MTCAYGGLDSYGVLGGGGGLYEPSYRELERELDGIKDALKDSNTQQLRLSNDEVSNEAMRVVSNSSACTKDADQLIIKFMQDSLNRDGGSDISHLSPSAQESIRESQRRNDMIKLSQMLVLREQIKQKCSSSAEKKYSQCPEHADLSDSGTSCICHAAYEWDSAKKNCIRDADGSSECPSHPISDEYPNLQQKCRGVSPTFAEFNCTPTPEEGDICDCNDGYVAVDGYCRKEEATPSISASEDIPSDVTANSWYSEAIQSLFSNDVLDSNEEFRPEEKATRGDFIKLLVSSIGISIGEINFPEDGIARFDDVPGIYQLAFEKAAFKGWLKGEGDCLGSHPCYARPEKPINRAEAAALIFRAFEFASAAGKGQTFTDVVPGSWYTEHVRAASYYCILRGDSNTGKGRPGDNLNRAEMAVMIWRAGQKLTYPNCQ